MKVSKIELKKNCPPAEGLIQTNKQKVSCDLLIGLRVYFVNNAQRRK
jgi:hypothetical protein